MIKPEVIGKAGFQATRDGEEVYLHTPSNKNGMQAVITNYGQGLVSLMIPGKHGVGHNTMHLQYALLNPEIE